MAEERKPFPFLMSEEERKMLKALAEKDERSGAYVLRKLIREAYERKKA